MELKCNKRVIISVEYGDLERFIATTFGLRYFEIYECDNDSTYEFSVNLNPTREELQEANKLIESGMCLIYQVESILTFLHYQGMIESGDYLVSVCW